MRVLMAGSSGFLGRHLHARLVADGHTVTRLVRRPARSADEVSWDPAAGQIDPGLVEAAQAVVNLAGAGVGDHRWTARYKELLRSSRVDSTTTLARAIAAAPADGGPAALLNASAIGWYGDTGDRAADEDQPAGDDFMASLCRVWEAAARPAEDAGARVVLMRTGVVLHQSGGLLKPTALLFRLGLGGRLGNGRQYLSWISLADWLDAVMFLLDRPELSGPVNLTGPAPVTNRQFTGALGAELHRPALVPVPGFALRLAVGEFGDEALRSVRVVPRVLSRAGFPFQHGDVRSALHAGLTDR